MINDSTVLILGAGMSKPYGFPTGSDLNDEIVAMGTTLGTSANFFDGIPGIRGRGYTVEHLKDFTKSFKYSGPISIDTFLAENFDTFGQIGMAAIAYRIAEAEERAELNPTSGSGKPYLTILKALLDGEPDVEEFGKNRLSIITFNYDRSLEVFLFRALMKHYALSASDAETLLSSIPFSHIHGSLGPLVISPSGEPVYGVKPSPEGVREAMRNIRIVSKTEVDETVKQAQLLIQTAKRTCFLGFGYDVRNLAKLDLASPKGQGPRMLGAWKTGGYEKKFVSGTFFDMPPPKRQGAMFNLGLPRPDDMLSYSGENCYDFLENSGVLGDFCQWSKYNWIRNPGS